MRRHTIFLAIGLSVLASSALAQSFKRIKTEADFREMVVDRKAGGEWGWFMVKSDGTTTGKIFGKTFNARWVWKNKMYCRNAVLGKEQLGTDCQVVKISGDKVQFIRKYGKGDVGESTLQ